MAFSQALETLDARLAHAEARLATHSSSESSLDQLPWPSFDDSLNGIQAPEGAEEILGGDLLSDLNDPFPSSETSSEDVRSRKRRATLPNVRTAAEDTMPLFLPLLEFDIDSSLPCDELTQMRFRSLSPFLTTNRGIASLSNAIWLHAVSMIPEKYAQWEEHCYRSARHHLEKLETEDDSGTFMSIDALQAIILLALYEFNQMYFARAWLTIGKAMVRTPAFSRGCTQRPIGHNWKKGGGRFGLLSMWIGMLAVASPMNIDDKEPNCLKSLRAGFCGRCLRHLQNAHKANTEIDYTYDFWSKHYSIDQAINQTFSSSLKDLNIAPAMDSIGGLTDPNTVFLNMNMRATTICLHEAAVVQAAKSSLPATLIAESESRSLAAAQEIASIMKLIRTTSVHLSKVNPRPFLVERAPNIKS
ncbi:MAG: hypothetical protein Q9221_002836 [Calogaya cf. arnoldii]